MIEMILGRLAGLLPDILTMPKEKRDMADKALRTISDALTETCLYVRDFNETGNSDRDKEAELARCWAKAAIPLRHFDSELSEICEYKAEYWLNPKEWSVEQANGIAIDLESVREKYRAKLN